MVTLKEQIVSNSSRYSTNSEANQFYTHDAYYSQANLYDEVMEDETQMFAKQEFIQLDQITKTTLDVEFSLKIFLSLKLFLATL